ncbi:exosortase A-associated hydrolase 2 [Pseudoduganella flava]|uniref:Exosortase A-associated hydrolase 2 n=1 Tax=Pseudoduganella flava TaxID=871742 RepID=A0A562PNL0_9BURK|nr:hydrolase 2, exosortase A system-associated [Pseudoduganella flava]QGZ40568.1 hydrolase 2, exosortase A system-associated [Pseudoduganella flava]TWI46014.1 exosortase A-associated hydrolase 2 [Pseudoduganella flava]
MHATAAPPPQPFFLDGGAAARFCLYHAPAHAPAGQCAGAWLYLHPFAEEMNKSRRMAALLARALAAQGHAVLQLDLYGCGDSAGDFGDARWETWRDDVLRGLQWLERQCGRRPGLWGLRLGALLALDVAATVDVPALLLWQPITSGAQCLTQFLRLKVASQMLTDGAAGNGTAALRHALAAGEALEIAGYRLDPALAAAIDGCDGTRLPAPACPVHWYEVAADSGRPLSPAAARVTDGWRAAGATVATHVVAGPQFWATQEIEECPALLDATLRHLAAACHAA